MQNRFRWLGLVLPLLLTVPAAADDKKNNANDAKSQQTTPQDINQLRALGEIRGKIVRVDDKSKDLSLQIEYQYLEQKGGNQGKNVRGQNANLIRQQQNIMRNRNPLS